MRTYCIAQGTLFNALWLPEQEGSPKGMRYMYIYSFPGGSHDKKNLPAMQETGFDPCVRKIPWRRESQPTPAFLPGEFHGQRSLAAYSPLSHKELDTTEAT